MTLGHSPDTTTLLADLGQFRPDVHPVRAAGVREGLQRCAAPRPTADGKGRVFDRAAAWRSRYSQALDSPGGPGLALRAQHAVFDRLVYGRLRAALGGRTQYAVSGGAPLGARLGHFFRGIGVTVLEGYGLTETSAASTLNTPDAASGSAASGARSPAPAYASPTTARCCCAARTSSPATGTTTAATAAVLDADGWFRTGDLGELDDDGFLSITGRKKEILVTSAGKNVAPAPLEDSIRAHPLVSQCIVVGDERPYVAALITLDAEALPGWLAARHRDPAQAAARPQPRTRTCSRSWPRRWTGPTAPCPGPRRSSGSWCCGGLHRGGRAPDPDAQAAPAGRPARLRGRRRGAVPRRD